MSIDRRSFLRNSSAAGTALLFGSLESFSRSVPGVPVKPGYTLHVMATNWGFSGDAKAFCEKTGQAGYDGIEIWMPDDPKQRDSFAEAAAANKLRLAFLYGGGGNDYNKHLEQFQKGQEAAVQYKPLYINSHSGKDYFSFEQNKSFMDYTKGLSAKTGIPIYHETHRGRSLYSAPIARNFIERIPELRLTFDVSHWCNVHESLLGDQQETIDLVLPRVDHIHVRVGHAEGPQVGDPRAPEWETAVKTHFTWWDEVVARKKKEGKMMTILTEFGPPDYLPTLPYTRQPVSNQWDINVHMLQVLKSRYSAS